MSNQIYYEVLKSILDKSDENYLQGRLLYFEKAFTGAGICLWLAIEQLIKLRITEFQLKNGDMKLSSSSKSITREAASQDLNSRFLKLGTKHKLSNLLKKVNELGINLGVCDIDETHPLNLICELFDRRYYTNKSIVINMESFNKIDKLYLTIRAGVDKKVCDKNEPALLDKILINHHFDIEKYEGSFYRYAFIKNESIHTPQILNKPYEPFDFPIGDGGVINFDGNGLKLVGIRAVIEIDEGLEEKWR